MNIEKDMEGLQTKILENQTNDPDVVRILLEAGVQPTGKQSANYRLQLSTTRVCSQLRRYNVIGTMPRQLSMCFLLTVQYLSFSKIILDKFHHFATWAHVLEVIGSRR